MTRARVVHLLGEIFHPDPSGALYWPAQDTLIVADLHLEKGSAFARRGVLLPPYDSRATLARLVALCARLKPRRLVALGDSFHDPEGPVRLAAGDRALLHELAARHDLVWLAGNHDGRCGAVIGGRAEGAMRLGRFTLCHEPRATPAAGEIAGHLHPCASLTVRGRRFRRRCFAGDGTRLVLPAFGAYTGGLDIFDAAFGGLFQAPPTAWLIGERAVHAIPYARLAKNAV